MGSVGAPTSIGGRYLLFEEFAKGGMASIHFGRIEGVGGFARTVAVKKLHSHLSRDPDFVAMFLDEARLAARVHHPNVVSTIDVVRGGDDELYLVMDYVPGESLRTLLYMMGERAQRMPPRVACAIVSAVLYGLHAAHQAKNERGQLLGLVHRDVSPQNVLVGTDGHSRIIDFGVAQAAGRLQQTRAGQLKGKLAYMSPEQVEGKTVTPATDVYGASIVLWEALTGERLFKADNEAHALKKVLFDEVKPPSAIAGELPRGLDAIVLRGLERDVTRRFATARDLARAIEQTVACASPSDVSEWLQSVAGESLAERARRVAEIEARVDEAPRPAARSSPRVVADAAADEKTEVTDSPMELEAEELAPIRRQRRLVPIAIACSVAVVAAFALLFVKSQAKHETSPEPKAATRATATVEIPPPPAIETPVPSALPTPTSTSTPTSTATSIAAAPPGSQASRPLPAAAPKRKADIVRDFPADPPGKK